MGYYTTLPQLLFAELTNLLTALYITSLKFFHSVIETPRILALDAARGLLLRTARPSSFGIGDS